MEPHLRSGMFSVARTPTSGCTGALEPAAGAGFPRRAVVADFGGRAITSDADAMLLGVTDKAIRLLDWFAACFSDGRAPGRIAHDVAALVGQRVLGIALGYEDLVDHDDLRRNPALGVTLGSRCAGPASRRWWARVR